MIRKAAGYAVFNNMGTNLLLLSTARGAGIAVNSKTMQDTFMKMISAGGGLGRLRGRPVVEGRGKSRRASKWPKENLEVGVKELKDKV